MKYRNIVLIVCGLSVFLGFTVPATMQTRPNPLKLTVKSDKQEYKLGEVVQLSFELKNVTDKDVSYIGDDFGISSGAVTVHISKDGKNFPEYNQNVTQIDFAGPITKVIKPDLSINSSANILWHNKPNALKELNKEALQETAKKTLLTDYAFPEAGTYYIKAVLRKTLESEIIKIIVEEPVGEDLAVWNRIKDRGDIAYFIQTGSVQIPDYQPEEKAKFQEEIKQLLIDYPNSFYAVSLQLSLDKFKASEIKRQEYREKLNNQKQ